MELKSQTSCATAISITPDGACAGAFSVSDAVIETVGTSAPSCSAVITREYWFTFTIAGGPRNVTITGNSATRNQVLQAFSGSCGALTEIGCADATTTSGAQIEVINISSLPNGVYYVRVCNTTAQNMNMNDFCITTAPPGCNHTIRLTDSYGDGWNGGTVTVTVNGVPVLTNITMATATAGPEDFLFPAASGDVINVTRTADGTFPSEMRVEVIGGAANTLLSTQNPVTAPGTDVIACCTPTVPALSNYTAPANGATGIQNCGATLSWDVPANNGCNAVVSYDVYFGTAASPPFVTNTTSTSYSTGTLVISTTYYWKIVPKNAVGDAMGAITWSFTTSATAAVPALATYTSPANGASAQNTCGVSLNWNEPAITGCNVATSYDVYFGTAASPPFVSNVATLTYFTGALSASTTYYWKIVPKNAVGNATGAVTWSFTSSASPCTSCNHTIRLTDTFGDGWNGGTVTVTVNGVPVLTNITMATATAGPEDFSFAAADGDVINVTRTADGSFPSEMRVQILGSAGITLLPTQNPVVAPGTNVSGCCSPTAPSCASAPTPANGATGVDPCSVNLSWTAPAGAGCNAVASYDIYFGTAAAPPFLLNQTGTTCSMPFALADNTTYYWKVVPKNTAGSAVGCATWNFTTGTTSNPAYCLYGNAINFPGAGTNCVQLTSASATQNGCAWNRGQISFAAAFDYSVQMYFGAAAGGADGCAFVFQNSPQGISQCGSNGGQLGAGGISNSVVIEFDTYDNDNPAHVYDMAVDHTAIEIDGDMNGPGAPLCGPVQADPLDGLLADGLLHTLRVTWDPATTTLCVYVDASLRITCVYDYVNLVFGGNPNVWWGFTGSTGLLANQQYFCPISIPVPVELLGFSADCSGGKSLLTWYTASETNNHYFSIEKSSDGIVFENIGNLNGSGNSNRLLMYQFLDETPSGGKCYYRLTQTDFDGTRYDLGIRSVDCNNTNGNLEIISAQTLNGDAITLNFKTSFTGLHTVQLLDINGKILEQQFIYCEEGFNQADFFVPTSGGIYLLNIFNELSSKSIKINL
ncbi:MAG: hypothetical protein CVU11_00195 [Bacteroidetes bacterium HGW-Bacteroidetes-6]|nr:MAG: hypothetical protein CVU11_00195 [Bacteroidetes bacterium HGW-Bacteroidetes-6]